MTHRWSARLRYSDTSDLPPVEGLHTLEHKRVAATSVQVSRPFCSGSRVWDASRRMMKVSEGLRIDVHVLVLPPFPSRHCAFHKNSVKPHLCMDCHKFFFRIWIDTIFGKKYQISGTSFGTIQFSELEAIHSNGTRYVSTIFFLCRCGRRVHETLEQPGATERGFTHLDGKRVRRTLVFPVRIRLSRLALVA